MTEHMIVQFSASGRTISGFWRGGR